MKNERIHTNHALIFSSWSRNSYAVFASIGKVVNIAHLNIKICISSLTKNQSLIRSLKEENQFLLNELKSELQDLKSSDWLTIVLLELGLISLNEPCGSIVYTFMNSKSLNVAYSSL